MRLDTITEEAAKSALENSDSLKDFIQNLGMKVNNGNYTRAKSIIEKYGLKIPTYNQSKHMENLKNKNKIPNEEYFCKGTLRSGTSIKKRLIEDYKIEDKCSICGQGPEWNGAPLCLQVDHIDGDRFNNELNNLRIVCPNCHTQTETYGNGRKIRQYSYCHCGIRISKGSVNCKAHAEMPNNTGKYSIDYPPVEDIIKSIIDNGGWSAAERVLGIGQNSLRKHLKRNGVDPSSIKYVRQLNGDKQV